jgi:cell division protein FtsB
MTIVRHLRKLLRNLARRAIGPVIYIGLIVYFSFFAIYGDRGLLAMRQLEGEVEQAQAQLAQVQKERQRIETRAALLRPDNLDRDMLDEQARLMLNYSHPDDVIMMMPRRGDGAGRAQPPAK